MKYFLFVLTLVAVLSLPTVAEARCGRAVVKAVAAPVKLVVAVKPVRRVAVLPVRLIKGLCRR